MSLRLISSLVLCVCEIERICLGAGGVSECSEICLHEIFSYLKLESDGLVWFDVAPQQSLDLVPCS